MRNGVWRVPVRRGPYCGVKVLPTADDKVLRVEVASNEQRRTPSNCDRAGKVRGESGQIEPPSKGQNRRLRETQFLATPILETVGNRGILTASMHASAKISAYRRISVCMRYVHGPKSDN